MADLTAAETAHEGEVTGKTHKDQAMMWCRWQEWSKLVGITEDVYLANFTKHPRIKLIGAFAMALHRGRFFGTSL